MIFGYVGICYKEAPLALRGQVALPDSKKIELWERLSVIGLKQCVIVSTCNRSEIFYFSHSDEVTGEQVQSCYQDIFPNVSFGDCCKKKEGSEAVSYLFRVAAGLESLVVGEDQILGQVVEAMDFARTMGHSGKELERIVRDAVTCAKWIKTNYRISEKPLSVSYIGVKELHRAGGVSGKNILVIGSGKTAVLALTYLFEYGAKKIYLCSRTLAHAKELLAVHENLTVVDYHERYDVMKQCETVVSATSSPHLVVLYGCGCRLAGGNCARRPGVHSEGCQRTSGYCSLRHDSPWQRAHRRCLPCQGCRSVRPSAETRRNGCAGGRRAPNSPQKPPAGP